MTDSAPIAVRRAVAADGAQVAELYLRAFRWALPNIRPSHSDEECRAHFSGPVVTAQDTWVALDAAGGQVLGFITARPGWIDHLYVEPDRVAAGVGSRLLRVCIDWMANQHVPEVRLYTFQANARARRFYESHGFRPVDFNDGARNDEREPDVLYRLDWSRLRAE
jgi:GNAT superfamily N-acetyltransferase